MQVSAEAVAVVWVSLRRCGCGRIGTVLGRSAAEERGRGGAPDVDRPCRAPASPPAASSPPEVGRPGRWRAAMCTVCAWPARLLAHADAFGPTLFPMTLGTCLRLVADFVLLPPAAPAQTLPFAAPRPGYAALCRAVPGNPDPYD